MDGDANDVEQALNYGADDCIAGSFEPRLFLAKVRALLRRFSTDDLTPKISVGDFTLYPDRLELFSGAKKSVTATECKIVAALMKHPNQTVGASTLSSEPGKLRAFIKKLRQKLDDVDHTLIQVDKGIGYRFAQQALKP